MLMLGKAQGQQSLVPYPRLEDRPNAKPERRLQFGPDCGGDKDRRPSI
jgi:hypothetical protein